MANFSIIDPATNKDVTTLKGSSTDTLKVKVIKNTGRNSRTSMLTVEGTVNGTPKEIAVDIIQKGELYLKIDNKNITIDKDTTNFTITGTSTGKSIKIEPGELYTVESTTFNNNTPGASISALGYVINKDPGQSERYSFSITFKTSKNPEIDSRNGIITFIAYGDTSSDSTKNTISITQNGTGISITPSKITIDTSGKADRDIIINVHGNTTWSIREK